MATKKEKKARKVLIGLLVFAVVAIIACVVWGLNYSKAYQNQGEGDVYIVNSITIPTVSVALDREVPLKEKKIVPISSTKSTGYFNYAAEDFTQDEAATYMKYLVENENFKGQDVDGATVLVKEYPDKQQTALLYIMTDEEGSSTVIIEVTPILNESQKESLIGATSSVSAETLVSNTGEESVTETTKSAKESASQTVETSEEA